MVARRVVVRAERVDDREPREPVDVPRDLRAVVLVGEREVRIVPEPVDHPHDVALALEPAGSSRAA
jgi:hypothetical protein